MHNLKIAIHVYVIVALRSKILTNNCCVAIVNPSPFIKAGKPNFIFERFGLVNTKTIKSRPNRN